MLNCFYKDYKNLTGRLLFSGPSNIGFRMKKLIPTLVLFSLATVLSAGTMPYPNPKKRMVGNFCLTGRT